jgi:hypothetical protein
VTALWVSDEPGREAEVKLVHTTDGWVVIEEHWELPSEVCEKLEKAERPDTNLAD